ncbi:MAG: Lar family restriction alleviation protein [Synergistaceae bacterium]|nr:Lar family restriction alleviation protein [Synergistaceae bacterium]
MAQMRKFFEMTLNKIDTRGAKIELKPCPFCGGEAHLMRITQPDDQGGIECYFTVECSCCANTTAFMCQIYDAVAAWNRRA